MKAKIFVWVLIVVLVALIVVLLVTPGKNKTLLKDIQTDTDQVTIDVSNLNTLDQDLGTADLDSINADLAEIENLV